ncbi:DCG1 [Candida margitis]|uniref:DCG1 n=1 Tax=Candida margitis TaxID=1775924 RepID=UPI002227F8D7|nr:DCG1 [Candida margitis]KAI5970392.1 DCG1 [Candida margitis]
MKILLVNPNSSEKVSRNMRNVLSPPESVNLDTYTAPDSSPREITGIETSKQSETVVLEDIKNRRIAEEYDGFIVCCYSDHPLIKSLAALSNKPVMGIMQATLLYALSNPNIQKSFILTSTSGWEPLLDQGIIDFLGVDGFPAKKFQKTIGLDIAVTNLANEEEYGKIREKVRFILGHQYKTDNIDCVLLGCAGMAGLNSKLGADFPGVFFIDSVEIALELLIGLIRFSK